jgi:hypothetical protein
MSLDWNAERIADFDKKKEQERWLDDVAYFCFTLQAIGVGSLTAKNIGDVYTRIQILNAVYGPLRYHYDEDTKTKTAVYDFDFLLSAIGYGTNVSNETFGQWIKRFGNWRIEEAQQRFNKALEKASGVEPVAV